ncbi:HlyD family secretion protein [Pseudomonas sessilinigenes]|uniref:HlyD family secretion protein n=1 Tax=Pseudomonas sessilinigenes TaxID=658629 RepID=A0ABX8MP38_9PSED|nr:HlyD family secretion protein [Pseudomonas sessilinigenes]AZC21974.1 Membrane fusion component of MSF-type tripartite multidrug efflux system [Pseudomonas sessilinigenes]QXH41074.1 HlyD family secretion protein [Pseudomonas sessilinigenes]
MEQSTQAQNAILQAAQATQTPRKRSRRPLVAGAIALSLVAVGAGWVLTAPSSESTDDAYVAADATSVAPRIHGLVTAVLVKDHQSVSAGQPLVRIDSEEFDSRVTLATGDLADSQAQVALAEAALAIQDAEQRLAGTRVLAARTSIRATQAESRRAGDERNRFDTLVTTGAVARNEVEKYSTQAISAQQNHAHAQAMLQVAQNDLAVTSAQRERLQAQLQMAKAKVVSAQARLELARQDQSHTTVYAPMDGTVGNRQVQVGDYVQPGSRLLTLVPLHELYVLANFKETQTQHMLAGQPTRIKIDALPGVSMTGTVESLAPGSGSTFALLPFEPGTGNFTKIVQRVPVRIRFDADQPGLERLRPGLSVIAKVDLDAPQRRNADGAHAELKVSANNQ